MDIRVMNPNEAAIVPAANLDLGTVFEFDDGETFGVIVDDGAIIFPSDGGLVEGDFATVFSNDELQSNLQEVKPRYDLRFVIGVEDAED